MMTGLGSSGDSSIIFLATTQASRRCPCPVLPPAWFLCILAALLPCPSLPGAPSPSAFHHGPRPLWAGDTAHPAATSKADNNCHCHGQQIPADALRWSQGSHSRVSAIKPWPGPITKMSHASAAQGPRVRRLLWFLILHLCLEAGRPRGCGVFRGRPARFPRDAQPAPDRARPLQVLVSTASKLPAATRPTSQPAFCGAQRQALHAEQPAPRRTHCWESRLCPAFGASGTQDPGAATTLLWLPRAAAQEERAGGRLLQTGVTERALSPDSVLLLGETELE